MVRYIWHCSYGLRTRFLAAGSVYRFEDPRGEVLVVLWDDGFSEANRICLSIVRGSTEDHLYWGTDNVSFDGDDDFEITAELGGIFQSSASQPMPKDHLSLWDEERHRQILQGLIRRVKVGRPPEKE